MKMHSVFLTLSVSFLFSGSASVSAGEFPTFKEHTLDANIGNVCYAVTLADVDGDKKQDIVAVTESSVFWYRNPDWKKFTIIANQTKADNVCIAPLDIDGDGKIDFALGAGWTKTGTIQWLTRGDSLDEKWKVHFIGEERWLHRMRFADVLNTGTPQLVISPLNKTVGNGVRLTAFQIPDDPKTERWQPTVLSNSLNRMHNHWHLDFNGNGVTDTLTASSEGVLLVEKKADVFRQIQLGKGAPGNSPTQTGAGEIKVGTLKNGDRYIVTVEPMHGNSVVVYTKPKKGESLWTRHVLDDTLKRGHALWTADVDGDGNEEIVLGHSDTGSGPVKGPGVYIYNAMQPDGTQWEKHIVDNGGIATEDLIAADLNGDGKVDIVAGGRASHNLKLYLNQGSTEE